MSRLRYVTLDPTLLRRAVAAGEGFPEALESAWMPVNVWQEGDVLHLEAALPGVPAAAIEVELSERVLTIGGTLPAQSGPTEGDGGAAGTWLLRERQVTRYERKLRLPWAVDESQIEARVAEGVLRLTLPKAAHLKPQRIVVQPAVATTSAE